MEYKTFNVLLDLPISVPVEAKDKEEAAEIAKEVLSETSNQQLALILIDAVKHAKIQVEGAPDDV